MEFDISVSQVTHWLDDIPAEFSHFEISASAKSQGALKRQRSSTSSKLQPSKRRQLISPPASQVQRSASSSSKEMDVEPTTTSTPSKKRPADDPSNDDNDQTPRADSTRGRRGLVRKAPSISSQSSSAYSRDSKRSRGSQSPLKMWPLLGPNGHKLLRASPTASNAPRLPALRRLVDDFGMIERGRSIMPQRIRKALEENDIGGLDDGMFFDDDAVTDKKNRPCSDDLIRQALRIAKHSNTCSSQLQDEAAWNNLVHSRLLDLFLHDMQDGPGQDILDLMPCVTTNMNLGYHFFDEPASRVDYIVRLLPELEEDMEDDESLELLTSDRMPTLNWTTNQLLPIAFSIETKRYGGDIPKGEQQLGIWNAAQWEFLISKAGIDAAQELDFVPGVVVNGDIWSFVITTRNQSKTTVFPGIVFGNTRSIIGVFQVIAGLRRLRRWALEVLWPWYKRHLPGLADPSRQQ
ncbi:hypothetical protein ACHAPJ_010783 [Fusarium lateritium]